MNNLTTIQLIEWVNSENYNQLANLIILDRENNIYYIGGVIDNVMTRSFSLILIPSETNNNYTYYTITPSIRQNPTQEIQRVLLNFFNKVKYANKTLFQNNDFKLYTFIPLDLILNPDCKYTICFNNLLTFILLKIQNELI
jgi:hypothetical protein